MEEQKLGLSTQTLVSNQGTSNKASKLPQYFAALSATLGAFALGTTLGWTTPTEVKFNDDIRAEWSWVGSLMPLGAAAVVLPIGYLIDRIGRKKTMLLLVLPFCAGWALIIWADGELALLLVGRFITGAMGGAFSLTAPVYTSEIAEPDIRGTLGSCFQLMTTIGILFVYVLGSYVDVFVLSLVCGVVPLVFGLIFFFMPDTPQYYMQSGRPDLARESLQFFRGKHCNVDAELMELETAVEQARASKTSFRDAFSTTAAKRGLVVALGLMLFQQLSGVNAVIFNTSSIFRSAGSAMPENEATMVVGAVQVLATLASTMVVDRLGRRFLLLLSDSVMALCTLLLGVYYYLDETSRLDVAWLPVVCLCLFMVVFSLGYGPIPWMMVGELFPPQIKGVASSVSCLLNWLLAFLVTKFFADMRIAFGDDATFWVFAVISAIGTVFVFFVVPETKGKSLEEIQRELGGEGNPRSSSLRAEGQPEKF